MKLTEVSPHAHQLTKFGFVNCYLVRESGADGEGDSFTLIDASLKGSGEAILEAAQTLGAPVRRMLLTHAHVDHVGSVDELVARLPGVMVATSERSLPLLRRPADKTLRPDEPQETFGGGLPGIAAPVTHLVQDGELFGSLRAIATPGHIPGHLSFLDERDGTLYAGDALAGVTRLLITGYTPWYLPVPRWVVWSKTLALTSAKRLLGYPLQRFACGHGAVREGGMPALREAIERVERRTA